MRGATCAAGSVPPNRASNASRAWRAVRYRRFESAATTLPLVTSHCDAASRGHSSAARAAARSASGVPTWARTNAR